MNRSSGTISTLPPHWVASGAPVPSDRPVHALVEAQAAQRPEAPALLAEGRIVSYGELNQLAERFAVLLRRRGVGAGDRVAVLLPRSPELIVALLGTLKAGAAYLPLEATDPAERLTFQLADARVAVLVASELPPGVETRIPVLDPGELTGVTEAEVRASPLPAVAPDSVAYVIYTSGSTGTPKGVMVEHRNILRIIRGDYVRLGPEDSILQLAAIAFDASTFEIWGALANGGRLVLAPPGAEALDRLGEIIRGYGVTTMWLTAALFEKVMEMDPAALGGLRRLLTGGDVVSPVAARRFLERYPDCCLINGYGPTETTVFAATYPISLADTTGAIPIGRPVNETRLYLLDESGQPVPEGEAGELYVGGAGVARGYLDRPELTAERFLDDPFVPGGRVYRTGDRVRWRADGVLEFLGRLDAQIKIRGFRVEPGEVEVALAAVPGVQHCAVVGVRHPTKGARLVAFYVPTAAAVPVDGPSLRARLKQSLPGYMVPFAFERLDALPLTRNGKVDRPRLVEKALARGGKTATGAAPEMAAGAAMVARPAPGAVPADRTVHELVEEQAALRPEAPALTSGGRTLSYGELNQLANRFATLLRQRGVHAGDRVALVLPRCHELIVAMLGTLKAGAAYIPLDVSDPAERLTFQIADAEVALAVAQDLPEGVAVQVPVLHPDEVATVPEAAGESNPPAVPPDSVAYMIYTSGSTGVPKGVMVEHRGILRIIRGRYCPIGSDEVILNMAAIAFDVSTFEIWGALANGARLVLPPDGPAALERLGEIIRGEGVTTTWLTAALFEHVMQVDPGALDGLRRLLAGGDVVSPSAARRLLERSPAIQLINGYGPTEGTVFAASYPITLADTDGPIPIGRPVDDTRLYVMDEAGQPLPAGAEGELYIGGVGVARGYFKRPQLTAEKFVPDPFGEPGARLYRTGDRVRWRADGVLEYLGRFDSQLKIRGFRVEPGEVEVALAATEGVGPCAVVGVRDPVGGPRLVAFYVPRDAGAPVEVATLHARLKKRLPAYMVPSEFRRLHALPVSRNGKTDRQALAELAGAQPTGLSELEAAIARIWAELLERPSVGRREDFFELGGHSLLATVAVARLGAELGLRIPLKLLFLHPTVEGLAAQIEAGHLEATGPAPLHGPEGVVRYPLSTAEQRLYFLEQLTPGTATYVVAEAATLQGRLHEPSLRRALETIVRRHDQLRAVFQEDEGVALQTIAPPGPVPLPLTDLSHLAAAEQPAALSDFLAREARCPFDLEAGPPIRARLVRLGPEEHVLLVVIHHIVTDGWSMEVLRRELAAAYNAHVAGRAPELPALTFSYADYVAWEAAAAGSDRLRADLAYWCDHLNGLPALLPLPARPAGVSAASANLVEDGTGPNAGGEARVWIEEEQADAVRTLARQAAATPHSVLLAAYAVLLARTFGLERLIIGCTASGRPRPELEPLIGFFVATLPLRADLSGEPSARELVVRLRDEVLAGVAHQEAPLERIVAAVNTPRAPGRAPLVQALFSLAPSAAQESTLTDLASSWTELFTGSAKFDLALLLAERAHGFDGRLEYDAHYFTAAQAERLASEYAEILRQMCAQPGQVLSIGSAPGPDAERHLESVTLRAGQSPSRPAGVAPRNELEGRIAAIWSELLRVPQVSVTDDFFELGGHSLLASIAVARIGAELGVRLPLRTLFLHPTIAGLASQVEAGVLEPSGPAPVALTSGAASGSLSAAQRRVYYLEQLVPNTATYNLPQAATLTGKLDESALRRALETVVQRHAQLRAIFREDSGSVEQVIAPPGPVPLPLTDLSTLPPGDGERELTRFLQTQASRPFDLRAGPLFRAHLVRLAPERHVLLLVAHHIVTDGWSMDVLRQDMAAAYNAFAVGTQPHLPELPLAYTDYAAWEEGVAQGGRLDDALEYWRRHLRELPALLPFSPVGAAQGVALSGAPGGEPGEASRRNAGGGVRIRIQAEAAASVRLLARRADATPHAVLFAAFALLLARECGLERFIVGGTSTGRPRPELETLVGFFVATLPLRADISGDPTSLELVARMRDEVLAGVAHEEAPLEHIVAALGAPVAPGRAPLVQAAFSLAPMPSAPAVFAGLECTWTDVHTGTAKFELALLFTEQDGGFDGRLEYDARFFRSVDAERLGRAYSYILGELCANPDLHLSALALPAPVRLAASGAAQPTAAVVAEPRTPRPPRSDQVLPRNELEQGIAAIWRELLDLAEVGVTENFFEIGGHSLLALDLLGRVGTEFGRAPLLGEFVREPTIEVMARELAQEPAPATSGRVSLFQRGRPGMPPLFFLHGHYFGGMGQVGTRRLLPHLRSDLSIYLVEPYYPGGPASVEDMAADAVKEIRAVHPDGPYLLGGFCNGGALALEVAQQLHRAGQEVPILIALDWSGAFALTMPFWRWYVRIGQRVHLSQRWARPGALALLRRTVRWVADGRSDTYRGPGRALSSFAAFAGWAFGEIWRRTREALRGTPPPAHFSTPEAQRSDEGLCFMNAVLARYIPAPYPGRTAVIAADETWTRKGYHPFHGWQYINPQTEMRMIAGNHASIFDDHAADLGRELRRLLDSVLATETERVS